jgi:ApaG protein
MAADSPALLPLNPVPLGLSGYPRRSKLIFSALPMPIGVRFRNIAARAPSSAGRIPDLFRLIWAAAKETGMAAKYSAITRHISVTVYPAYLDDESVPEQNCFFWAYHVVIENRGTETVQLRSRHWRITNARGELKEVRGPGVVGEQPRLKPADSFEYTSAAPLTTPSGIMLGSYQMENKYGESFDIEIPAFSLDSPHQAVRFN